ncbi:MAG: 2OG-Fe(II) oxygenase [Gammaproteobacteria bacterium]|nr:2OG-Fe(II) oxygenase [Gammaproteobacteria bacterium]
MAELTTQSWSVQPLFFSLEFIHALKLTALAYQAKGLFQAAKIGHSAAASVNSSIRSDETHWISQTDSLAEQRFCIIIEALRHSLNQALYLNLTGFESHFAHYAIGNFYKKHLDRFEAQSTRCVSIVVYLNDNWQEVDGGELILYDKLGLELAIIQPKAGTLVCFLSDAIPHEVKPALCDRWSIAGWFKTRD